MMSIYVMHIYKVAKIYSTNKGMPKGIQQPCSLECGVPELGWPVPCLPRCLYCGGLEPWTIDLWPLLLCMHRISTVQSALNHRTRMHQQLQDPFKRCNFSASLSSFVCCHSKIITVQSTLTQ